MSFKKGQTIHPHTRIVIYKVFQYMTEEANMAKMNSFSPNYFKQILLRVSCATGASVRSISKIVKEGDRNEFKESRKERSTPRPRKILNELDYKTIRDTIHNLQMTGTYYSISTLLTKFKKEINFNGGRATLRSILKDLGFQSRLEGSKQYFVEKMEVKLKRMNYIKEIIKSRSLGQSVYYIGVIYINTRPLRKTTKANEQGVIIMNAVNENGFVPGALIILESLKTKTAKLNSETYKMWLINQLIPKISSNAIVVINTPTYVDLDNTPPTLNNSKSDMIKWLNDMKVDNDSDITNMTKNEVFDLVKSQLQNNPEITVCNILKDHGHTVLGCPHYHPNLSPIETIFAKVKKTIQTQYENYNLTELKDLVKETICKISELQWKEAYSAVKEQEEHFVHMEGLSMEQLNQDSEFKFEVEVLDPLLIKREIDELDDSSNDIKMEPYDESDESE